MGLGLEEMGWGWWWKAWAQRVPKDWGKGEGIPLLSGFNGTSTVLGTRRDVEPTPQGVPREGGGPTRRLPPKFGAGIEALSARNEGAKELPMAG